MFMHACMYLCAYIYVYMYVCINVQVCMYAGLCNKPPSKPPYLLIFLLCSEFTAKLYGKCAAVTLP